MPKRTNSYQSLIKVLHTVLLNKATVVESAMLRDKVTEEEREVDILISTDDGLYKQNIAIEVIDHSRPAGTPWVESMITKHQHLPINKSILVSKSGFTKPARKKAAFHNMETISTENALKIDWPIAIQLGSNGTLELISIKYDCAFVCKFTDGTEAQIDVPLNSYFNTDTGTMTIDQFINKIINQQSSRDMICAHLPETSGVHDFWIAYTEPNGLWQINHEGKPGQVEEMRIGLQVTNYRTPFDCAPGNYKGHPFLAGQSSRNPKEMQFVLVKKPDGSLGGNIKYEFMEGNLIDPKSNNQT